MSEVNEQFLDEDCVNPRATKIEDTINMYLSEGVGQPYHDKYAEYLNRFFKSKRKKQEEPLRYNEFIAQHRAVRQKKTKQYPPFHEVSKNEFGYRALISDLFKYQYYNNTNMEEIIPIEKLYKIVGKYGIKLSKQDTSYGHVFYKVHTYIKKWQSKRKYGVSVYRGATIELSKKALEELNNARKLTAKQAYDILVNKEKKTVVDRELINELYKLPNDCYIGELTQCGKSLFSENKMLLAYIPTTEAAILEKFASDKGLPLLDKAHFVRQNYRYISQQYYNNGDNKNKLGIVVYFHNPKFSDAPPWAGDNYFVGKYRVQFMDGREEECPCDGFDTVAGFMKLGNCIYAGGLKWTIMDDKQYFTEISDYYK